jgi:hypothetical protein
MSSLRRYHPRQVYVDHRDALELMVEILEAAVEDSLPEARRRHPLPGPIPGELLSPLVRDRARMIALSVHYEGETLRAAAGRNLSLHLWTRDDLLRIRVRKMPDPETPVPLGDQLELPFDYAEETIFGPFAELALLWAVKGDALYRVVLAAPDGWDDPVCLSTWHGAVEVPLPATRRLTWTTLQVDQRQIDTDDLDDAVGPRVQRTDREESGDDVG